MAADDVKTTTSYSCRSRERALRGQSRNSRRSSNHANSSCWKHTPNKRSSHCSQGTKKWNKYAAVMPLSYHPAVARWVLRHAARMQRLQGGRRRPPQNILLFPFHVVFARSFSCYYFFSSFRQQLTPLSQAAAAHRRQTSRMLIGRTFDSRGLGLSCSKEKHFRSSFSIVLCGFVSSASSSSQLWFLAYITESPSECLSGVLCQLL